MSSDEGDQEELVFEAALQAETETERKATLDRLCASDTQLRARVEKLLAAYEASQAIDTPIVLRPDFEARFGSLEGKQVGAYEVLQPLGEGGIGEVYLGRSIYTRQLVAIKTIKPGMDTRQVVSRFEQERKALQHLQHPNIAEFIESGVTEMGRAYFVMELVRGLPITDYCQRHQLDLHHTLRLFTDVCHAVHYANSCGMVHRDIKPNNVLVRTDDPQPVVKVIDFGIAKALSADLKVDTLYTGAVQWLGTPAYMSPEQSQWSGEVDQRSDVYALGVMLFELITGRTPISLVMPSQKSFETAQAIIAYELPPRPSHVLRKKSRLQAAAHAIDHARFTAEQLRSDLDWIVLKALEKSPLNRYQSVVELNNDFAAFMQGLPVSAKRPAHLRRVARLAQALKKSRSLWLIFIAMTISAGILLGLSFSTLWPIAAATSRENSVPLDNQGMAAPPIDVSNNPGAKTENIERLAFIVGIRQIDSLRSVGRSEEALTQLEALQRNYARWRDHFLVRYLQHTIRKPNLFETKPEGEIAEIDLSPDGKLLVMGDVSGNVKIWDWPAGELRQSWKAGSQEIQRIRFSPNGQWLATAGQDKEVIVWDAVQGLQAAKAAGHERTITGLSWSADSQSLATSDRDGLVIVWNATDLSILKKLKVEGAARALEYSPGGQYLAASNEATGTQVWNTSDWSEKAFIPTQVKLGDQAIAFSHDSRLIAVAGHGPVRVFNLSTGATTSSPSSNVVGSMRFGPHGDLYIGCHDGHVEIANVNRGWRRLTSIKVSHESDRVRSIDFAPGDKTLAVGLGSTGIFRWIDIESVLGYDYQQCEHVQLGYNHELNVAFEIRPDPHVLVGLRNHQEVCSILTEARPDHVPPVYLPSENALAVATARSKGSTATLFDWPSGRLLLQQPLAASARAAKRIDAQRVLYELSGLAPVVWDVETNQLTELKHPSLPGRCTADYSATTREFVVAAKTDRVLHRYSTAGDYLGKIEHNRRIHSIDFVAALDAFVVGEVGSLSIWSSDLKLQYSVLLDQNGQQPPIVTATKHLPDDDLLAVITEDGTLRLIDLSTRLVAIELPTNFQSGAHIYFIGQENPNRLTFGYGSALVLICLNASERKADSVTP